MALGSTLHAAQSGGIQRGEYHTPQGVYAMLVFFIKHVFGYMRTLLLKHYELGS